MGLISNLLHLNQLNFHENYSNDTGCNAVVGGVGLPTTEFLQSSEVMISYHTTCDHLGAEWKRKNTPGQLRNL